MRELKHIYGTRKYTRKINDTLKEYFKARRDGNWILATKIHQRLKLSWWGFKNINR